MGNKMDNRLNRIDPNIKTPDCLIADYRLTELLGEGAAGKTYLAIRRADEELVAIKALKLDGTFKSMELFEREAKTLSSIDVPGVPKFYGYVKSPDEFGAAYLIQQYVKYQSLQTLIYRRKIFTQDEVVVIMLKMVEILDHLQMDYTPAIIHRDIKPSNILYSPRDNSLYLIDFGAVANPQKKTNGSTVAGTLGFLAPEQLMGECTIQSDFYALGATALYMLTNVSPVDMQHDKDDPFKLEFMPHIDKSRVSNSMIQLLNALLSTKTKDRPKNTRVLKKQLLDIQSEMFNGRAHYGRFDSEFGDDSCSSLWDSLSAFCRCFAKNLGYLILPTTAFLSSFFCYEPMHSGLNFVNLLSNAMMLVSLIVSIILYIGEFSFYTSSLSTELEHSGTLFKLAVVVWHFFLLGLVLWAFELGGSPIDEINHLIFAVTAVCAVQAVLVLVMFVRELTRGSSESSMDLSEPNSIVGRWSRKGRILYIDKKVECSGKQFCECSYQNKRGTYSLYIFERSDMYQKDGRFLLHSDDDVDEIIDECPEV